MIREEWSADSGSRDSENSLKNRNLEKKSWGGAKDDKDDTERWRRVETQESFLPASEASAYSEGT